MRQSLGSLALVVLLTCVAGNLVGCGTSASDVTGQGSAVPEPQQSAQPDASAGADASSGDPFLGTWYIKGLVEDLPIIFERDGDQYRGKGVYDPSGYTVLLLRRGRLVTEDGMLEFGWKGKGAHRRLVMYMMFSDEMGGTKERELTREAP